MTGRGSSPRYLPLLFVLKRLMNWRVEKRPWEWEQMPGDFGSVSGEQRGCSLFPRLSARLLFWLTSASAWDATSAPATKHTSSSTPHTTALLLLLLLQATAATALGHHLLLDHVDDLVRDAEVLDGAATDVTLGHPPEFVPILSAFFGCEISRADQGQEWLAWRALGACCPQLSTAPPWLGLPAASTPKQGERNALAEPTAG